MVFLLFCQENLVYFHGLCRCCILCPALMSLYDPRIAVWLIKACNEFVMRAQLEVSCEYGNR